MAPTSPSKVLVAVDAGPHSDAVIAGAAAFARRLEVELTGLHVLDTALLRLAGLPAAAETGMTTVRRRLLNPATMERQLRLQAERVRSLLEAAARQHGLSCSYRICRGIVADELLRASSGAELLVMGFAGQSRGAGKRPGTTLRRVVGGASCSVLLMHEKPVSGRSVVVALEGGVGTEALLRQASALAEEAGRDLVVLAMGYPGRVPDLASGSDVSTLDEGDFAGLCAAVASHDAAILLLRAEGPLHRSCAEDLRKVPCPVLLYR